MSSRGGIWKETDQWVDRLLDYCIDKVRRDIGDKTYQRETSLRVLEPEAGPEPTAEYHRGFDDGVRAAILTLEFIKEGQI